MRFRPALCAAVLLALPLFAGAGPAPPDPSGAAAPPRGEELPAPQVVGRLPLDELPESSGLVKSPRHAGVFWTQNDSGNPARLHAVDATGKLLRALDVPGARNVDWEELALDEQGRLLIADFGDNNRKRIDCVLYRLAEPDPHSAAPAEKPRQFHFAYPKDAGPQDAEALVARAGHAYIFTKEATRTRCFRVPLPETPPQEPAVAEPMGESDAITVVTGAALTPDGRFLALLTYNRVLTVELPAPLEKAPAPFEGKLRKRACVLGQCEGIAWDESDLLISTEKGPGQQTPGALWRISKAK